MILTMIHLQTLFLNLTEDITYEQLDTLDTRQLSMMNIGEIGLTNELSS